MVATNATATAYPREFVPKELTLGTFADVEPLYREGRLFSFSPGSYRLDGPDQALAFTGRPDPTIVSETRIGNHCPLP